MRLLRLWLAMTKVKWVLAMTNWDYDTTS